MDHHRRVALWQALADHFLDTETRHTIPGHALQCVEAGLARDELRTLWCYEVAPAVWQNLWDPAGEWAGWDPDWLVARIEKRRGRWPARPGWAAYGVYRLRVHGAHAVLTALEGCVAWLEAAPPPVRRALADDAAWLAAHYFAFLGRPLGGRDPVHLRALYERALRDVFASLEQSAARAEADARVRAALSHTP